MSQCLGSWRQPWKLCVSHHGSVQNRIPEQIDDVPVPRIMEDGLPVVPQERVQNRQIVDVPVPQIKKDGVLLVPQERVHNRAAYTGKVFTVKLRHHRDDRLAWRTLLVSSRVSISTICLDLEMSWCPRLKSPRFPGLMGNLRLLRMSLCTVFIKGTQAAAAAPSSSGELLRLQQSRLVQFLDQVIDVPVAVLVRFGGISGGFTVAVLQLGKLLLVLFARMLDITSSRSVSRQSRRLLERCLSFSSSTSGGYFSCYCDRVHSADGDSMVQFWMVVDVHVAVQMTGLWFRQCITAVFRSCGALSRLSMSFAVHRQGVDVPVILQGPETLWCSFGWSSTCLKIRSSTEWWIFQLPHSAYCAEDQRFHGAVLGWSLTRPLVCKRQGYGSDSAENCGFRRCSVLTRLDVPLIMQRREVSQLEVPQIQSSPESADISVATETSSLSAWMAALKVISQ